jgi:uncharacterized protein YoxC
MYYIYWTIIGVIFFTIGIYLLISLRQLIKEMKKLNNKRTK